MGTDPDTVYWMDESDAKAITLSRKMEKIKEAKWGTPKKKLPEIVGATAFQPLKRSDWNAFLVSLTSKSTKFIILSKQKTYLN